MIGIYGEIGPDEVGEEERDLPSFSDEWSCAETLWEDGKYTYVITYSPREAPEVTRTVKDDGTSYDERLDDDALQEICIEWMEAQS